MVDQGVEQGRHAGEGGRAGLLDGVQQGGQPQVALVEPHPVAVLALLGQVNSTRSSGRRYSFTLVATTLVRAARGWTALTRP